MIKILLASFIMLNLGNPSFASEIKQSLDDVWQKMDLQPTQDATHLSHDDDEQDILEVEGVVVLRSDSSSMTSSRYGTDPYALVDVDFTPNEKLGISLALFQSKNFDLDEAAVTWHVLPDNKLNISAGRQYVSFGSFDTAMVSSPLTEIMGITRSDKVLNINTMRGSFDTTAYIFDSSSFADDRKNNSLDYGLSLDYGDGDDGVNTIGISYISNLASSDQFSSEAIDIDIPGVALHSSIAFGSSIDLILEHIRTTKSLKNGDLDGEITQRARPSVSQVEINIDLKRSRLLALAWNKTSGTEELIEDNIRKYVGVTYSQSLYKALTGAIELARYTHSNDESNNSVNLQVIYSF